MIKPRFAAGRDDVVAGYSVAERPPKGGRPVWFGGRHLAKDLTLPRLRGAWADSPELAGAAVAEWGAAARGRRPVNAARTVLPMGNFETLVYSNGVWERYVENDAWDRHRQPHPYIAFAIHDSDFAVVDYRPATIGSGRFYLRLQPRDYFEDRKANPWVDIEAEAAGLTAWAHSALGRTISPDDVREFVAPDKVDEPEDVFVEETMERLLRQLGLGMPDGI